LLATLYVMRFTSPSIIVSGLSLLYENINFINLFFCSNFLVIFRPNVFWESTDTHTN